MEDEEETPVETCDASGEEEEEEESISTLLSLVVQKNPPLPSMCRARLEVKKPKLVSQLIKQLEKHSEDFDLLNKSLSLEMAILGKMGYKYSCNYRPFHFWAGIRRVLQCCKRINELNVSALFTKLHNSSESFEPAERLTYLPSVRLVEYFMIRFMASVSLFATTAYYCSKVFATSKLCLSTIAHHVPQHLLIISIASRLWTLCNSIAQQMIDVYTTVFRLRKSLLLSSSSCSSTSPGVEGGQQSSSYIPDHEKFPKDLYMWLKKHMDWSIVNLNRPDVSKSLSLKKAIKKLSRTNELTKKKGKKNQFNLDEDIGEPV